MLRGGGAGKWGGFVHQCTHILYTSNTDAHTHETRVHTRAPARAHPRRLHAQSRVYSLVHAYTLHNHQPLGKRAHGLQDLMMI